MPNTHRGVYHQKRQGLGWLSSRNLALTLTELPSGGYTAYLKRQNVTVMREYNSDKRVVVLLCVSCEYLYEVC